MKKFELFLIAAVVFALSACAGLKEKAGCMVEDKTIAVATDVIVKKLQCKNVFAVHADVKGVVDNLGLCPTGPIGDVVCPMVAKEVVNKLVAVAVPAEWGCTAENAKATLQSTLESSCKAVVPVKH
jgi:hypothetical protein